MILDADALSRKDQMTEPEADQGRPALEDYAARVGAPLRSLGGAFMLDAATITRGEALGIDFATLYGLGRGGVLGDVPADVIAAAFVFFEPSFVSTIWETGRAKVRPDVAAVAFTESCRDWVRAHLGGLDGLDDLCLLTELVVHRAHVSGWR